MTNPHSPSSAPNTAAIRVLRVDASGRGDGSTTRALGDALIERLTVLHGVLDVTRRDVAQGLPFVSDTWIGANFTDPAARSDDQKAVLAGSDALVAEVKAAEILVIGAPIYNFGIPASLKAWIDQIARARETFHYTDDGPVGLLDGKKAYLIVASGGTEIDSQIDFATPYLRHVLGFVGIHDVTVVAAARQMADHEAESKASAAIAEIAA